MISAAIGVMNVSNIQGGLFVVPHRPSSVKRIISSQCRKFSRCVIYLFHLAFHWTHYFVPGIAGKKELDDLV